MHNYSVIVSNIGEVYSGSNGAQALREFGQWRAQSRDGAGRASGESVTLFRDGEPWREHIPGPFWFFELTDTYGGEANYSWVTRFKVSAPTLRAALRKVSRECGFSGRIRADWATGDLTRWNISGAALCVFGQYWDEDSHSNYLHVKGI